MLVIRRTHISAVSEDMRPSLIFQNPVVPVDLGHLHRMRVRAGKFKALIMLVHVTVLAVHHVLLSVFSLEVDPVPAGGELDVYLKLCNGRRSELDCLKLQTYPNMHPGEEIHVLLDSTEHNLSSLHHPLSHKQTVQSTLPLLWSPRQASSSHHQIVFCIFF